MPSNFLIDKTKAPIGVFDSGVGGTSIWKEIHQLLPFEHTIYLADSKNAPYGIKSKEHIIALSKKNTELLLKKGAKIIVVACNTATTNAIKILRDEYPVPFIGIEPAIKPASLQTKTKKVGILATKGTLSSELFHKTSSIHRNEVDIIEQEGTGIVELIEGGKLYTPEMENLLLKYLEKMIKAPIDYLVLGCSHYPYLIPILQKILPDNVKIIDSGQAVAKQTKAILEENHLLSTSQAPPIISFFTNGEKSVLKQLIGDQYQIDYLDF